MYLQTSEEGVQGKDAHPVFSHILSVYPFYPPASQQTPIEGGMDETSLFFPSCYTFNWPKLDQILVPKIGKREDTQSIIPKVFPANFPPSSLRCLLLGPYAWEIWEKKKKRLGKSGKKPQFMWTIREHCFAERRALGSHGQADTQTDVEAFAPYGTTSARHKEQTNHAENRPTKQEAISEQFAGSTPGVLSVRTCFQQWLGLTLHTPNQSAEMQ